MAVDNVGIDVCVKFCVFRINNFSCRTYKHDEAYPNSAKRLSFRLKMHRHFDFEIIGVN